MKNKTVPCLLVVFSVWTSLFSPFIKAQNLTAGGLQFKISEAEKNAEKPAEKPEIKIADLSPAEADAIFRRLPPMLAETDKTDFKMPADSLKPPKTGNVVPIKFPADENQATPDIPKKTNESLRIERFSPVGDATLVSDLSVTFSQPMTAVASQMEASENVPVKLSPEVEGVWRWLGTNTLVFDAVTRFPMATEFTATIPKGTRSAAGGVLEKEVSWTFRTPPPKIEVFAPKDEQEGIFPEYAIMAAKFNQGIDEREILPKIRVFADGKQMPIRLVTDEVDESFTVYKQLGKDVKPKHWLAFRTVELLPKNADVKVVFEKGLPSGEGEFSSESEQEFSFKTLTPFTVRELRCGYKRLPTTCEPSDNFEIHFNRSMAPNTFDKSFVKIEPAIKDFEFSVDGSQSVITVNGTKKPNTTYKITLAGNLLDFYKQPLGKKMTVKFEVGTESPQFFTDGEEFVTLDPNGERKFSVYSQNHKKFTVKLYAVTPADYVRFRELLRNYYKNRHTVTKVDFGRLVFEKTYTINRKPDFFEETEIDLAPALPNRFGHAVLVAFPLEKSEEYEYRNSPTLTWIQSTDIGLDALVDYEKLLAFATDLKTAKPLNDVKITLNHGKFFLDSSKSSNGIAEFNLIDTIERGFLLAEKGFDSAILREPQDYAEVVTDWRKQIPGEHLRWFVFDDRKMYRPDETVSVKGYLRKVTGGKFTDIAEIGEAVKSINYVLRDSRNNEILRGTVKPNAFGAFDLKLNLPENINLGHQNLELKTEENLSGNEFRHRFQVQEFRRPEFEVSAKVETNAPFFVGDRAEISATAKYYSGGFLKNAETVWNVVSTPTSYTPPNRDDFTFGKFVPWWKYYRSEYGQTTRQNFKGTTDADGEHRIELDFETANPARPYNIRAEAQIADINRQTFASAATLLVHPSTLYVGIRTPKTFVKKGEKLKIETITTDIDGRAVTGKTVSVEAELSDWQKVGSHWKEVLIDRQSCEIISTETVAFCEIPAKAGGTFTIKASVLDERERRNESELTVWVAGGGYALTDDRIAEESVELIPDKKRYEPGDTAEILVNSPFFPAEGVLTLDRNGILKTERFKMDESSKVLQISIEEKFLPNVHVRVDLVGTKQRVLYEDKRDEKLPKRPAFASGELKLEISKASRNLNVTAEPIEKTLAPGGETKINVEVTEANGNPSSNTEVAVVAVDESVLALTNYKIQDPLESFYTEIPAGVSAFHSREDVLLSYPDDISVGYGYGSGSGDGSGSGRDPFARPSYNKKAIYNQWLSKDVKYLINAEEKNQIKIRRNFDALAIFSPSVVTDENGRASVELKLPDNLTRYRITAVAVTKSKQFGKSESNVTAKTALQIRPSAPRFLNYGDRAELPVVLQNQTDSPMTVNVAIRSNIANLTDGNGKKVSVPANERAEIRFPIKTEKAGLARFQIGAVAGDFADAAEIFLPVYTPATSESFATYGTTDKNGVIVQQISAPKDVFRDFGGLEVTTSSTQLQELTDAFIYLQNYPFECSEQISSRVLSVAALRDVLEAFQAKDLPTKEEIEAKMKADIERLQSLQHADGGWSFWRNDDESIPFVSVHVAHALARAKAKGYEVPPEIISKSLNYLKNIEAKLPKEYSEESRLAISAYALYVRDLLGEKDTAKAKKLLQGEEKEKLSAESLGWLLSVLVNDESTIKEAEAIKQNLLNRVTETAAAAHFVTNYRDGEYVLLSSERRADGVILEALLHDAGTRGRGDAEIVKTKDEEPTNDVSNLIPKIVRGLLAHRTKGRWQSTQENAFVLLALDKYFHTFEKVTPDFTAKIWLGESFAGEQKFAGRTADSNSINVPMNFLQRDAKQNLLMDKEGEGRLYYRIGLKYAPKNLKLNAADYGFIVSREYAAVDDAGDVRKNRDGSWTIKSGSRVRVNIKMVAPTRRYHVALVDNLPAGIEIINPDLATSGSNNFVNYTSEERKNSFWFNHQNLRDNRAEAFTSLLWEGIWNYSYLARAATPGTFVVPPAKAEEMYSPETFGRSGTDFVKVE